jgi:hypothetical protein
MTTDEGRVPPCAADVMNDPLAVRVARLFRHAGEHEDAMVLRELVLGYRREQAAAARPTEDGDD